MTDATDREANGRLPNPLGEDGFEFVEYTTDRPQALGQGRPTTRTRMPRSSRTLAPKAHLRGSTSAARAFRTTWTRPPRSTDPMPTSRRS